ncbi:DUF4235 domain-containing protein [Streptomyces coeruleorubidus]|uniref:DUF4235 domain-containing protein n=1 Tax=Streptomyces coeruleorubidus TaxID=116188 RepID=UPI0037A275B0
MSRAQAWKTFGHDEDAPDATAEERTWQEVLLAATCGVRSSPGSKPSVDRAGAVGAGRLTGTWPG